MKIQGYYRDLAAVSLNGSIAALIPAIIIVAVNIIYIQHKQIMVLTIPFLIYSLLNFQIYLFRKKQSMEIARKIPSEQNQYHSLFETRHLLLAFMRTQSAALFLYFPNGYLAGRITKQKGKLFQRSTIYVLSDPEGREYGYYQIRRNQINVYNQNREYVGCFEKEKQSWLKNKKELLDAQGKFIGKVEGSPYFMDEKVLNSYDNQEGRLRRGWMPLEWSSLFPDPNTPVLTLLESLSEKDKLLRISILVNEYFIER